MTYIVFRELSFGSTRFVVMAEKRQRGEWEELTLVQRRGNGALHPCGVIINHVDGEIGVPMRDNLHRTMALCPLGVNTLIIHVSEELSEDAKLI